MARSQQRWERGLSRLGYASVVVVLALMATVEAAPLPPPQAQRPSPMAEPLRLIALARAAYGMVNDYTCVLVTRERIDGNLMPENVITMQFKKQPFSVLLRWNAPHNVAGREVCYVVGRHGGKMRLRPAGLAAVMGWLTVAPDDPRGRKMSRHDIREAGIGHLIEQFARGWEEERQLGQTQVRVSPFELNNRRGLRVETIHPTNAGGKFQHYRDVLYFDDATHLLTRMECYDWPHRPGAPEEMIEMFDYTNLRANVGLRDSLFHK